MLRIARFFLGNSLRNYNYFLVGDNRQALIIDPTEAEKTLQFVRQQGLKPEAVWITHEDYDHTGGADQVSAQLKLPVLAPKAFAHLLKKATGIGEGDRLDFAGHSFCVKHLPGHTPHHHVYYCAEQALLISGDMLFNYGSGKVRQGQHKAMFDSLQWLASLPDETVFLTAHDYDIIGLRFALSLEPENRILQEKLAQAERLSPEQRPLPTIGEQRQFSPYFLLDKPAIVQALRQKNMPCDTPFAVYKSIRLLRDRF